ncbi:MAG: glycoside hydrolase family 1 protein [Anaerolineaceae bacterium]
MPRATFNFPNNFLWGCATASHQVEGNNTNNDWWAWEQGEGHILNGDKSGRACDWWAGKWREDFDRAQETYQNAHRFSVEWSRIQPEPDRWDENALDHYREMLVGLKERHLTAMVTLHHFSNPLWLAEMGGWENDRVVDLFAAYVRRTVQALKAHCNLWVTINEPNVYMTGGYFGGGFPPGKLDIRLGLKVLTNLVKGHAAAYRVIHELQPDAQVGVAHNWRGFAQGNPNPLTKYSLRLHKQVFNDAFAQTLRTGKFDGVLLKEDIPQAKGTQDYVGLNYYSRDYLRFNLSKKDSAYTDRYYLKEAELSENGFIANDPQAFSECIRWGWQFDLPIYITENGCEDSQDDFRRKYLVEHIHKLWHMVNFNAPVKGYFHWSLVDNFEWERGWSQRFGLWGLDTATQTRIRRKSVDLYADICRTNSLSSEMVEKHVPEVYDRIYPA